MQADFVLLLTVFVLAMFVGFEVITKVPPTLHTPLMSGSNAISGITIIGALISAGAEQTTLASILGVAAVALATINVVGGFMVTNRMLAMFKNGNLAMLSPSRALGKLDLHPNIGIVGRCCVTGKCDARSSPALSCAAVIIVEPHLSNKPAAWIQHFHMLIGPIEDKELFLLIHGQIA